MENLWEAAAVQKKMFFLETIESTSTCCLSLESNIFELIEIHYIELQHNVKKEKGKCLVNVELCVLSAVYRVDV